MENKILSKKKKRSISKKITIILGIPLALFLIFYFGINLLFVSKDTSKDTPIYTGKIISDANQSPLNNNFGHFTEPKAIVKDLDLSGKIFVIFDTLAVM